MTLTDHLATLQINPKSIITRMLLGGLLGFIIISLFVFSVDNPNPEWGKLWRVKPLVITPLATAFGSLIFYSVDLTGTKSIWKKVLAIVFSVVGFIIALWLGIVLGLNGTLWN